MNVKILKSCIEVASSLAPTEWDNWPTRCFHLSFAIYNSRVIAIGVNKAKTNPINLRNKKRNSSGVDYSSEKMTCSELSCLNKIKNRTNIDYKKICLFNVRIDRNAKVTNARPCESCQNLICFLGVGQVFYTTAQEEIQQWK